MNNLTVYGDTISNFVNTLSDPIYGNSEKYDVLKENAILIICEMLINMRSNFSEKLSNNNENFPVILEKTAELRHSIAIETGTKDAEEFAMIRDEATDLHTFLVHNQYKELNEKIKDLIIEFIPKINNNKRAIVSTFGNSRYIVRLEKEMELLNKPQILLDGLKRNTDQIQESLNKILELPSRLDEIKMGMSMIERYKSVLTIAQIQQGISENSCFLDSISNKINDQNIYVFSGRIEIKNEVYKWLPLSRHFSVITCNDNGEIGEKDLAIFKSSGIVDLMHPHGRDLKVHASSMSQLFNKILDPNTPSDKLNEIIREFEYRSLHVPFFRRGSKAITEIIVEGIKRAFAPHYTSKGDYEAFAEPYLSNYMK